MKSDKKSIKYLDLPWKCLIETLLLANLGNLSRSSPEEMEILVSSTSGNCSNIQDQTCRQLCPVLEYLLEYFIDWKNFLNSLNSLFILYWFVKIVVLYCMV